MRRRRALNGPSRSPILDPMARRSFLPALFLALSLAGPLASQQRFTFVAWDDYAPFCFREGGELKGIFVDILRTALETDLGLPVVIEGYPWARSQTLVKDGLADAFLTVPTPERLRYSKPLEPPVIIQRSVVYTSMSNPERAAVAGIRSLADARSFPLVSYLGNGWAKANLDSPTMTWVSSLNQIFAMISAERTFVLVDSELVVDWQLLKLGLKAKVFKGAALSEVPMHVCIGLSSPWLPYAPKIEEEIRRLQADGRLKAIIDRWK